MNHNQYPVYYLVAQTEYKDTKSILNIRFARLETNRVTVNFSTIGSYPIKAGEDNFVFSCFNNNATGQVENNRLVITALDENGQEITSHEYRGLMMGTMLGSKGGFKVNRDYANFSIKSELYSEETG